MMRNIFITGRIHNVSDTPLTVIQQQVQEDIDKLTGGHYVDFRISQISIITGLGLDGFELPEMWPRPSFGIYTYFFEKSEFIRCYQKSANKLGAGRIRNLQVDADYKRVMVKLVY